MSGARALVAAAVLAAGAAAAADPLVEARGRDGWVSWVVPLQGRESPCCYTWRSGEPQRKGCRLERHREESQGVISVDGAKARPAQGEVELQLYLRFDHGDLRQLLAVGSDCPVARGAQRVTLLEGVEPATSAAFLLGLADEGRGDMLEETLLAVSLHERVGTDTLLGVARDPRRKPALRRQALFWLGQSEDPRALAEFEKILSR